MSEGAGRLVWSLTGESGEELGAQKRSPLDDVQRSRSCPDILVELNSQGLEHGGL